MTNVQTGRDGEEIAEKFLIKNNYQILEKNFHFGRYGEIDIIAKDEEEFVFVEVKYSKNSHYGYPENRITASKKSKVKKAAEGWLYQNNIVDKRARIDVIAIIGKGPKMEITHYINAF